MALTKVTGQVIKSDTNITSHNINSSGIITAVSFSGPLDTTGGNFTGIITATSATFSGNVTIGGTLTYEDVTNIDSVGLITARAGIVAQDDVTFTGATSGRDIVWDKSADELKVKDNTKISFGTDRDLQLSHNNSDSVISHIGSATGNLKILSGGAQSIECVKAGAVTIAHNGNTKLTTTSTGAVVTGILTATTFSGSIAASNINSGTVATARLGSGTANSSTFLRGDQSWAAVTSTTINNNTDNYVLTGTGTADTINGEANLTMTGNILTFNTTANSHRIQNVATGDHYTELRFDSNRSSANNALAAMTFYWDGDQVADIIAQSGADTSNKDDGHLIFRTSASQGSIAEVLRITSDGKVGINSTAPTDLLSIGAGANTLAFGCKDTTRTNHVWQLLNNDNSGNAEFRMYKNSVTGTHAQSINFATSGDANYILDGPLLLGLTSPTYGSGDIQHEIKKNNSRTYTAPLMVAHSHLLLNNSDTTTNNFVGIGMRTGTGDGAIGFVYTGTANHSDFVICTDSGANGSEKLRIKSNSGYVGINTTNPQRYIHIVGNDGATGATLGNSDSTMVLDNKGGNGAMIEFLGDNTGAGHLMFTDTDGSNRGRFSYSHNTDSMRFDVKGQEALTLYTKTVSSTTSAVLGINDNSPATDALGLVVRNKGSQESALPVVLIQRDNNSGGGSSTDEIALKVNMPYTYNGAGDCYGIKSYAVHNLNSTHYAGYFEARGSQYSAGGDGAGIYAQITKTDTNGPGYVPAAFFYGKHTYNASDSGYAMGIRVKVQALTKNTGIMIHHEQTNSDWTPMIRFCKGSSATEVGTIKSSDTATQYNTSSDYRLKENVVDLTGAITRLKQLKPKRFNFKNDTSKTVDGFIAHEVEPVVPQAVSGIKDAVKIETVEDPSTGKTIMNEDGTPKTETKIDPQEVDYSKLSTLTIAALQEALAKIETLEAKVAALEGS